MIKSHAFLLDLKTMNFIKYKMNKMNCLVLKSFIVFKFYFKKFEWQIRKISKIIRFIIKQNVNVKKRVLFYHPFIIVKEMKS